MYAQQARTGVPELDAVLATAQMVTPDGGNTVAAHVAQAAVQKFQPQQAPSSPGIGALMPGVRQQAVNAAQAAQPVTQAQMQQALQQSQMAQQSQGVAGLPAQNMRTFTAAQGGVVGYDGTNESYVVPRTYGYAPDYEEAQKYGIVLSPYDSPEVRAEKLERIKTARETGELPPPGERESAASKDASGIMKALKFVASPLVSAGAAAADVAMSPINLLRRQAAEAGGKPPVSITPVTDILRRGEPAKGSGRGEINPPMAATPEGQRLGEARAEPTKFEGSFASGDVSDYALNALRQAAQQASGIEKQDLLRKIAELEARRPKPAEQPAQPTPPAAAPTAPAVTPQSVADQARALLGAQGPDRLSEAVDKYEKLLQAQGPTGVEALAAIREAQRAAKEQYEQGSKDVAFNRLQSFLRGMASGAPAGGAAGIERFMQSETGRQQAYQQLMLAQAKEASAIDDANAARAANNQGAVIKALKEVEDARRAKLQIEASLTGTIYTAQSHEAVAKLNREAQEKLRTLPDYQHQRVDQAVSSYILNNPGTPFYVAFDAVTKGNLERQDVAELKALAASLKDQADPMKNLDKASREKAQARLEVVQEKLMQLSGIGAAQQLPPAALSQLKEGVATTFANGQQWTLENGQPKRVK